MNDVRVWAEEGETATSNFVQANIIAFIERMIKSNKNYHKNSLLPKIQCIYVEQTKIIISKNPFFSLPEQFTLTHYRYLLLTTIDAAHKSG